MLIAPALHAQDLPSGQQVALSEVLIDEVSGDATVRFRFLAPGVGSVAVEDALADLETLCADVAIPYLGEYDLSADVLVISLMDRPVPFGETDAEATQLFDAFRLADGECVLEPF